MAVLLEKRNRIAIVTISRPEELNALNTQTLRELLDTINKVEEDDEVRVMIITGDGRSFVAGADIKEMSSFTATEGCKFGEYGNQVFMTLENLSKPTIAAVNGFALGGGCELAMACDIRLAGEKAKFGQPETGLGITPGFGGTQRLSRLVGVGVAMELILSAKKISAAEAMEIGLVNHVYPQEELMDKAIELAECIASNAQVAVKAAKRCIRKGIQTDINTGVAYESEAFGLCFSTDDQKNAMKAFINKEKFNNFKDI